jgi:hypothetical protein
MPASRSDSYILGQSVAFQNRAQQSMVATCIAISSEGGTVAHHSARLALVHQILANPTQFANYVVMFSSAVATDATVLADATQAGTVVLTTGNVATQSALVTDAHLDSATSGMFNAFVQGMPV